MSKTGIDYAIDRWTYRVWNDPDVPEALCLERTIRPGAKVDGPTRYYCVVPVAGLVSPEHVNMLGRALTLGLRSLHMNDTDAVRNVNAVVRKKTDSDFLGRVDAVDRVAGTVTVKGETISWNEVEPA